MSRTATRVLALVVLGLAASASADDRRFYFTKPFAMSEAPPTRAEPRDNVSTGVKAGASQLLGEFVSSPLAGDGFDAGSGAVTVFLTTGQQGMTACAEVGITVSRVTAAGRTVVGSGALATSILPRRESSAPIVVPVDVDGVVAEAGDQVAVEIVIGNACDGGRNVTLLYDSLAAASRIDFAGEPAPPPPPPPVGTTTTSTTPTTTTLPPSVECAEFPNGSFAAVECWLGILTRVAEGASPEALGGARRARRIGKRIARIGRPLEKARSGRRVEKRLRSVGRRLAALQRQMDRLAARGRIDAPLGVEISGVAAGAIAQLDQLLAATS